MTMRCHSHSLDRRENFDAISHSAKELCTFAHAAATIESSHDRVHASMHCHRAQYVQTNDLDGIVSSASWAEHVECQFPCGCDDRPQDDDEDDELWLKNGRENKFHVV